MATRLLYNYKTRDAELDTRITALEGLVEEENGRTVDQRIASAVNAARTALETKNTEQDGRLSAVEGDLATLKGSGEGSVSKAVSDAIAGVVASAPEDFDTLKEIADYIASDTTGAAGISSALSDHGSRLDVLEGDASTAGSVAKAVADAVDAEADARADADDALEARLDILEGNASTEGSVAKSVADAVAAEAAARGTAVSDEASARAGADSALSARLDVLEGDEDTEGSVAEAKAAADAAMEQAMLCVEYNQGRAEAGHMLWVGANGQVTTALPDAIYLTDDQRTKTFMLTVDATGALMVSEVTSE